MKLLGENETEAVLERLDRLNHEEALTVAAQMLEIVYGLVKNMRLVMDGAWRISSLRSTIPIPRVCLAGGKTSTEDIRQALGLLRSPSDIYLLTFGASCDAAHCKQSQQVPAFVVVYTLFSTH